MLWMGFSMKLVLNDLNDLMTLGRAHIVVVQGDGGYRVSEVRAGTTSPKPGHKGFENCQRSTHSISKWIIRKLALLRINFSKRLMHVFSDAWY